MSKRTRLILFISFALLYLIFAPVIVFYSLGYRFDFDNKQLITTGAVYLQTWPSEVQISVGENVKQNTNILSNVSLIQGLSPEKYDITVEKEGYYPWSKNLEIKEQEVTRIDNVTLIKQEIVFNEIEGEFENFPTEPPVETGLTKEQKEIVLLKLSGVISSKVSGNYIIWLSNKGLLLRSDINAKTVETYNIEPLEIDGKYEILLLNNLIFLNGDKDLLLLDRKNKSFKKIHTAVNDIKISPLDDKIVYYDDYEILTAHFLKPNEMVSLSKSKKKITDLYWFNDNYLIFVIGGKIEISEIDIRDKVNVVTIPRHIVFIDKTFLELMNPKISWDYQTKKLSVLENKTLIESEPLTDRNNK